MKQSIMISCCLCHVSTWTTHGIHLVCNVMKPLLSNTRRFTPLKKIWNRIIWSIKTCKVPKLQTMLQSSCWNWSICLLKTRVRLLLMKHTRPIDQFPWEMHRTDHELCVMISYRTLVGNIKQSTTWMIADLEASNWFRHLDYFGCALIH